MDRLASNARRTDGDMKLGSQSSVDEVICVGSTFCISYRCRTDRRRFDAVTTWYFATLLSL